MLLSLGASPNSRDRKGRTPAHCGAEKGQLETLQILVRAGAAIWEANQRGDLPLHEAVKSGRRDLVKWLLSLQPGQVDLQNKVRLCRGCWRSISLIGRLQLPAPGRRRKLSGHREVSGEALEEMDPSPGFS